MSEEHAGIVDPEGLRRICEQVRDIRAQRTELNTELGGVMKAAKDAGYVPEMIRGIVREMEMEDDARETFFATQDAYRRAVGLLADLPLGEAAAPKYPTHRWGKPPEFAKQPLHRGRRKSTAADDLPTVGSAN